VIGNPAQLESSAREIGITADIQTETDTEKNAPGTAPGNPVATVAPCGFPDAAELQFEIALHP
jgi:hypothetical protein